MTVNWASGATNFRNRVFSSHIIALLLFSINVKFEWIGKLSMAFTTIMLVVFKRILNFVNLNTELDKLQGLNSYNGSLTDFSHQEIASVLCFFTVDKTLYFLSQ